MKENEQQPMDEQDLSIRLFLAAVNGDEDFYNMIVWLMQAANEAGENNLRVRYFADGDDINFEVEKKKYGFNHL